MSRRRQIIESLKSKAYRDAFVRQQAALDIPFQIKGMRELRELSQAELAAKLNKPQSVVSRLENPRYGKFTLTTLHEIAAAFDVALLVTFLPFSKLVDRAAKYSIADVEIQPFDKDEGLFEPEADEGATSDHTGSQWWISDEALLTAEIEEHAPASPQRVTIASHGTGASLSRATTPEERYR